jgi:hypothetical protein
MDGRPIGGSRHEPVKHVEFADQVPLADPADGRIARHLARIFRPEGEQPNTRAAPGRGSRGFTSGMAGADHQNVVHAPAITASAFHVKHQRLFAEAETAKKRVEHVLHARASG